MRRREFLRQTAILTAGTALLPAVRASAQSGQPAYDVIIVGAGPAGCIAARRLVDRFPDKSILLVEAGGPTSAEVGGHDFPPYDSQATIFDVPGEYTNIAFQPKGEPYKQKETPFTYQGVGFGGNSQFNGMLFQAAPPFDLDNAWPWPWRYRDLRPYVDVIRQAMHISPTPSTDGLFYNAGASQIVGDIYAANGFKEVNTSALGNLGDRYYSRAYVVSRDGLRGGPVHSHLAGIVDGSGQSTRANFTILPFAKVDRIVFDTLHRSRGVGITYLPAQAPANATAAAPSPTFVRLREGGHIVLAAGALMSPRLLLLSGVGPFARHGAIFPDGFSVPFHIDNPAIGTSLFDHVATSLTYEYTGAIPPFEAYQYGDYAANTADLAQYAASRSGPYAQYGPVSVMQYSRGLLASLGLRRRGQPNVEVFVNPFGSGPPGGPYNGPRNFSAFAMLLRPRGRGLVAIGADTFVKYPPIYLTRQEDLRLMAEAIQNLIFLYRRNRNLELVFGPGGRSHPHLNPERFRDVEEYVAAGDPFENVYFTRLIINHWGGTCPLGWDWNGAVDPWTLRVKGTRNIHVIDASLQPAPLSAHPVATIMVVAEKASDVLTRQLRES